MPPPHKLPIPASISEQGTLHSAHVKATRSLSLPSFGRWRSISRQASDVLIMRSLSINGIKESWKDISLLDVQSDEEEVSKEEAICRICMLELDEGNETFRMDCCCKGELALAHKDCAKKWFSLKGNNRCDVCNNVVSNLPVLLIRRSSSLIRNGPSASGNVGNIGTNGSWGHTVAFFLSSALTAFWDKLQDLSEFP